MITAEHLSRSFSGNGLKLRDLNFHIEKGDCVGLIGPNGSGKRSLIRLLPLRRIQPGTVRRKQRRRSRPPDALRFLSLQGFHPSG